jgi:WD40 repeat protein
MTDIESKYRAFLSYSHADKTWADWLHKTLESYVVPHGLVGQVTSAGPIPKRLFPIFRDREELPSSPDLNGEIETALRQSLFLIVICSPHASQSHWVNEEILLFKRMGQSDRILALIVDGSPNADGEAGKDIQSECFPPALRSALGPGGAPGAQKADPIAADCRPEGDGRDNAKLKLIAGLLGVGLDTLRKRDAIARRNRLLTRAAIAVAVLVLLAGAATELILQWQSAQQQRANTLARLADSAADDNDFVRAGRLAVAALDGYDRPLISFDPSRAIVTLRRAAASSSTPLTLHAHSDAVVAIAYAPDSGTLTTASNDGTARIWNAATGAPIALLKGHSAGLTAVAYSPDGRQIATASKDHTARIWNAANGAAIATLQGHGADLRMVTFSPDGKLLATASDDKTVRLWRSDTRAPVATLSGHRDSVWWIAFSPDGKLIATGSKDKTVRLWDMATGAPRATFTGPMQTVDTVAFAPNSQIVYGLSQDGTLFAWDIASGKAIARMRSGNDDGLSFAQSPDGTTLAVSGEAGTIRLWDGKTYALRRTLHDDVDGPIGLVAFSPDNKRLLSTSTGGDAELWDVAMGVDLAKVKFDGDQMIGGAIAPDGLHFAYGSLGGETGISSTQTVSAGRLRTDTPQFEFTTNIIDLGYSADGRLLITGGGDGSVRLWNGESGLIGKQLQACKDPIMHVALSGDGTRAAASCGTKEANLWDTQSGNVLATIKSINDGNLIFNRDGSLLAVPLGNGTIRLVNARDGSTPGDLPGPQAAGMVLAFSPDGSRLLAGSRDEDIRVYDVAAKTLTKTLKLNDEWTYVIAFSGDGKRFATAGSGPVHLWDAATLNAVATEAGFQGRINALAFSPDGRSFAAASDDGTSRVWNSDTGQEVAILRGHGKQVVDLAYLGNGKVLATLSWDRSLQIWDITSATELFHFPVEHVELRNPDDPNSASVDESEGHSIHDYDWVGILKAIPHQDAVLTSFPEGTARFWRVPPALTEPAQDVATSLCGDLLKGPQARLTEDDRRSFSGFTAVDDNVCRPPTLIKRVLEWAKR